MCAPPRRLFEDIAWGTSAVRAQTAARAREVDRPLFLLPEWYDVDTPTDLDRLRDELAGGGGEGYHAPHTRAFLAQV